jgi:hypothetical protein
LAELHKLGFDQGRNLLVEYRSIGQDIQQATTGVNDLIAWKADALFVFGPEFSLKAAVPAAPTPIVVAAVNFDPIAKGDLCKASRGPAATSPALSRFGRRLLPNRSNSFPDRKRLGMLWDALSADQFRAAEDRASASRLELRGFKLENPPYDFAAAFLRRRVGHYRRIEPLFLAA